MKVSVLVMVTVILSSSAVLAQDVQDTFESLQSVADDKKHEQQAEGDSVAETVDSHVDEKPSLELTHTEMLHETYPIEFNEDVSGQDSAGELHHFDLSESDTKKHEQQSESEAEVLDDSVAENVELTQIETLGDVETHSMKLEGDLTDRDPASEFHDSDKLTLKHKGARSASEHEEEYGFPPPFDESTVDFSAVNRVRRDQLFVFVPSEI